MAASQATRKIRDNEIMTIMLLQRCGKQILYNLLFMRAIRIYNGVNRSCEPPPYCKLYCIMVTLS